MTLEGWLTMIEWFKALHQAWAGSLRSGSPILDPVNRNSVQIHVYIYKSYVLQPLFSVIDVLATVAVVIFRISPPYFGVPGDSLLPPHKEFVCS